MGTLKDLALIQLIGVIEGIFSSLFLATPLLVSLVNRKKKYKDHNAAVERYRARGAGELEDEAAEEVVREKRQVAAPVRRAGSSLDSADGAIGSSTWRPGR